MIRIEPIERSLPKDWKRTVHDHPWLSICVAAAAGVYLGRNHGRQLLASLVSVGVAVGVEAFRRAVGIEKPPSKEARRA
jgi:hypothetical protein